MTRYIERTIILPDPGTPKGGRAMRNHHPRPPPWSTEEDRNITIDYSRLGYRPREIAKHLKKTCPPGRTISAVRGRLTNLGLWRRCRIWLPDEDTLFRKCCQRGFSSKQIADQLELTHPPRRTKYSIQSHAFALGLRIAHGFHVPQRKDCKIKFRLDHNTGRALRKHCRSRNISISDALRVATAQYLFPEVVR